MPKKCSSHGDHRQRSEILQSYSNMTLSRATMVGGAGYSFVNQPFHSVPTTLGKTTSIQSYWPNCSTHSLILLLVLRYPLESFVPFTHMCNAMENSFRYFLMQLLFSHPHAPYLQKSHGMPGIFPFKKLCFQSLPLPLYYSISSTRRAAEN